jgi:hypothetical protein
LWLELSYKGTADLYLPTITAAEGGSVVTEDLRSTKGKTWLLNSKLLGFVEGSSRGHISARGVSDPPGRFENWLRQNFDKQPSDDGSNGGKVWEHWCTTREIEASSELGNSILSSYIALCAAAGDIFVSTVARGRTIYNHPEQLDALIKAGYTTAKSASVIKMPIQVPSDKQLLFYEARPEKAYESAAGMDWTDDAVRYYMFKRQIGKWDSRLRVP